MPSNAGIRKLGRELAVDAPPSKEPAPCDPDEDVVWEPDDELADELPCEELDGLPDGVECTCAEPEDDDCPPLDCPAACESSCSSDCPDELPPDPDEACGRGWFDDCE